MNLSPFITKHREEILQAWERIALSRMPELNGMGVSPLRDHLGELLTAIASDLENVGQADQPHRNHAQARRKWPSVEAIAEKHGEGRAHQGLPLKQMVAELPALRACVARLWLQSLPAPAGDDLEDLVRFDEAIDFALTQSVSKFMDQVNQSRETFLSILGHDLRNPLSTMISAARLMLEKEFDQSKMRDIAGRIVATGERMHQLVLDLLDFTRTRTSGQMPVKPHETDLAVVVHTLADEFTTQHPERDVRVHVSGNLQGRWDDKRMGQAIGNLMANAVHHGAPDRPIDISTSADDSEVVVAVHNEGPPIPEDRQQRIFEPLAAASARGTGERDSGHLGLGLYIAKAIVGGHGGRIDVESSEKEGTTFTCHLPKGGAKKTRADEV